MNQSEFIAITCNFLIAREKSRLQVVIGFGFASHWLKNWREIFRPITKHSNSNREITFDSHWKTVLSPLDTFMKFLAPPSVDWFLWSRYLSSASLPFSSYPLQILARLFDQVPREAEFLVARIFLVTPQAVSTIEHKV